jgi:sortase A
VKALRTTGNVFIFLGLSILFFVLYELVGTSIVTKARQNDLQADFDAELAQPASLNPAFTGKLPVPGNRRSAVTALARIKIPKIGVNAIVVEGVTLDRLAYGPGHYPQTKLFGEKGVTGVAGHRTGWGAPFFNLDRLRRGDQVIIETTTATYTYSVTDMIVVTPAHSEVLDGNPKSKDPQQLVLTTCTPKFTAKNRMIVFTDLIKTVLRTRATPKPTPTRT